jgi:regulation of enolase protein 1 (concanavalin A-like superfamily)
MAEVIKTAKPGTDFWVFTSGYNFTAENARCSKKPVSQAYHKSGPLPGSGT